jgi:transcription termination/antitermination protein NusA
MNTEFIYALEALEKERGIKKEVLLETIETALISAYKKNYGTNNMIRVDIDGDTGNIRVFASKKVVETVEDENVEITLEEARKINIAYEPEDMLEIEVTPKSFGRIAAQTAKQVIVQRLREAERGVIYEEFSERANEVVTAVVHRVDKNNVYVELGKAEAVLPVQEMLPSDRFNINDRVKVYICDVKKTSKGPQILVSRTHPGLVKRLFEIEVPEILQNVVQLKSIAREAGYRTKVAVYSADPHVDPVGACVGPKGNRIERIVYELGNEKIDIIPWSPDPVEYIANALRPAKVIMVQVNETEKAAKVIVPDNQLSLAIGKEGQNARLAAKLTGWKIDIKSQKKVEEMFEQDFAMLLEEQPVVENTDFEEY